MKRQNLPDSRMEIDASVGNSTDRTPLLPKALQPRRLAHVFVILLTALVGSNPYRASPPQVSRSSEFKAPRVSACFFEMLCLTLKFSVERQNLAAGLRDRCGWTRFDRNRRIDEGR